jgi:hypothetical protein
MSADTIVFFENVMSIKKSEVILVENSEYLQLDVTGTANNFKINVYAQVTEDGDFLPLAIIGNSTFKIFNSITEKGLYRVDTSGILNIRVDLVEISNGTISCKGIIVNKDITVSTESDWEANEGEEGYIKNRTHWVENSFEPIIVDNITNGIISEETFDDNGLVFYKISEQALSEEQINGSTFGIELSNGNYGVSIIGEGVEETDGIAFCEFELVLSDGLVYGSLISSDNLDITPTIGTYIAFYPINFDQTTLKKIEFKNEVVHKLDRKFIPEDEIFQISIYDLIKKSRITLGENYTYDISETLLETIKENKFLELTNVGIDLKNNGKSYKCNILTKFVDYSKFSESIYDYDGTYLISENLITLDEEKINLKIYLYKPEQNSVPQISIIAKSAIESNVTEDDLVVKEGMSIGSVQSDNSIAGGKGYKLTAFTNNGDGTGICTVRTTEGLAVNMEYSIRVANMFCKAGKITAIDGLNITINGVPPEKAKWETEDAENPENFTVENYLTIVGHPELGDTDVGFNAIAVGEDNIAQDRASYTEGRQNKSIGQYAHTEGRQNIAGYAAHAEGRGNTALGDMSHVEGHENKAIGKMSHAEGQGVIVTGERAHGEGWKTTAEGTGSHSEGIYTIARGTAQHVQGAYNIGDTVNKYLHIVGNGESDKKRSNAHTISWDGDGWFKNALYVGGNSQFDGAKKVATEDMIKTKRVIDGEGVHSVIVGGWRENSEDYGAFGAKSVVLGGHNNSTSGAFSVVGGYESEATGPVAFALGDRVKATKNAAMAIGIDTQANAPQAFAGGSGSIANGINSFASGQNNKAISSQSFVGGANSTAGGRGYKLTAFVNNEDGTAICTVRTTEGLAVNMEYSIRVANMFCKAGKITAINGLQVAIDGVPEKAAWEADDAENPGSFTVENYIAIVGRPDLGDTDIGFNAVSIGEDNIAHDRDSAVFGRKNIVTGQYGFASGRGNVAGYAAHAEGRDNIALGDMSHVEGHDNKAIGDMSHAEGYEVIVTGIYAHGEGQKTTAEGRNSHAQGYYTESIGENSHSEGYRTIAKGYCQHVQGTYNIEDDKNYLHIVGNGDSSKPSNAHTISWNGDGWFKNALYVGGNSQFDGAKKVATEDMIVPHLKAGAGVYSIIVGGSRNEVTASGVYSIIVGGLNNKVSAYYAVAGGYSSEASGSVSFALGEKTKATQNAAFATGFNTQANGQQSFATGNDTEARGDQSFTMGSCTIANGNNQFVSGKFNIVDSEKVQIVGWGSGEDVVDGSGNIITQKRKNIYTLDTTGNAEFAGNVKAGRATIDEDSDLVLVTKGYMTEKTEDFTVEVTYTYDTETVTANTAFADIQQAIISGKNVVLNLSFVYTGGLYIEDEKLILPLAAFYEDSRVVFATAQTNKIYTVSCRTGESWHFEESTIEKTNYTSQIISAISGNSVPTANAVVSYVDNKIGNMFNLKGSVDYYQDLPASELKHGDAYRIQKDSSFDPYRMVIHQVYNEQANIFQMTASGVEGIYFKFNDVENWDELVEGKTSIELIITDSGASNRHSTFSIPISQTLSYTNSCICKNGASIEAVIIKSEYENYDSELFPLIMETETDDGTVYMSFADDEMVYVYDGTTHAAFAGDIAVYVGTNNDTAIDSDDDGWCVLTTNEAVIRNPVKAGSKSNSAVIGNRATAIGMNSIAYGTATAKGNLSLAGGGKSEANGTGSIAIGNAAKTNSSYCVALGNRSEANAGYSVALGFYTKTEGAKAIAAGNHSEANGDSSVAIGYYSIADGDQSAAFGYETYAGGDYSLATGMNTSANGDVQFVSGRYNKKDEKNKFAVIVGNGEDEDVKDEDGNIITQNRSNAYTLNWEGDAWYAGRVKVGRSTTDEDEDLVLVSKDYLKSYVESYVESAIKEAFNITEADEGKVLKVVDGKAVWVENEFPEVKPEDEGRYLQIVNGAPTWVELDYQNAEEVAY